MNYQEELLKKQTKIMSEKMDSIISDTVSEKLGVDISAKDFESSALLGRLKMEPYPHIKIILLDGKPILKIFNVEVEGEEPKETDHGYSFSCKLIQRYEVIKDGS